MPPNEVHTRLDRPLVIESHVLLYMPVCAVVVRQRTEGAIGNTLVCLSERDRECQWEG